MKDNATNRSPLISSFEVLNYDMVLKALRAKSDYATVFKTAQPFLQLLNVCLNDLGRYRPVLCIQNTVADPGEGPALSFRPN